MNLKEIQDYYQYYFILAVVVNLKAKLVTTAKGRRKNQYQQGFHLRQMNFLKPYSTIVVITAIIVIFIDAEL